MAKKRKRKVKRVVGKRVRTVKTLVRTREKKRLVFRNLILFALISIVCYILYTISNTGMFQNLFWLLSMVTGFVALAFLIVWLVFLLLKVMEK